MPRRLITVPFVLVTVAVFLGAMVPNFFNLVSEYLQQRGYDPAEIGSILGAFTLLGSLPTMALIGRVIERGNRAVILAAGCLLAGASCIVFELADSMPLFIAARALQGIGFGAVLVSGPAYVAEIAPPRMLAQALGYAGVLTLAAQAVAPAVGELLKNTVGWEWMFRVGFACGVAGAVVAMFLPAIEPHDAPEPTEPARAAAAWPGIAATLLAGFGFGAVFLFLAAYAARVGIELVTPFFASYVVAAIATRLWLGHLSDRFGYRATATPMLVLHTVAVLALAKLSAAWQLVPIGLAYGLAHGIYYPALQALIVDRAPRRARARAIAAASFAFGAGVALASYGLGALADYTGYPPIYVVAAAAGGAAAVLVWTRT